MMEVSLLVKQVQIEGKICSSSFSTLGPTEVDSLVDHPTPIEALPLFETQQDSSSNHPMFDQNLY